MKPTVILFDIDGTLITTGGAGRRSIERAFSKLYQRPDACSGISFSGMTDWSIVRLGLEAIQVEATAAAIEAFLSCYLECLAAEVKSVPDEQYRVHRGMRKAIDFCVSSNFAVGLGTGNVREGARVKLERVGLYQSFQFGGFGDDHELRPELIRRGAQRGLERLGVTQARVVIIGDTPKDVHAAHAIGAECITVTTGGYTIDALREAGADWAFETLEDDGAVAALAG